MNTEIITEWNDKGEKQVYLQVIDYKTREIVGKIKLTTELIITLLANNH